MSNKVNKPLEELVRSALKDHEMPYDPSAWNSLSSKLDAQLPVNGKSKFPWFVGAAAALSLITVGLLYTSSHQKTAHNKLSLPQPDRKENITTLKEKTASNMSGGQTQLELLTPSLPKLIQCGIGPTPEIALVLENEILINEPKIASENGFQIVETDIANSPANNGNPLDVWKELNIPSLCLGETQTINNNNSVDLIIRDSYSNEFIVPAFTSHAYTAVHEGKHDVINARTNEIKESFVVKGSPQLSLQLENDLVYEKGLPTTILNVSSSGTAIHWQINNNSLSNESSQLKVHLFSKGAYTFKASTINEFGCKTEAVRTLFVDDEYNLLAVNAFDPQSSDNRKNAFMPFALTVREVDFELIIIDPKDGGIVFESNDATQPWRGQDKRNGHLVEAAKTFIWRVVLSNPQPGEKAEYKGTIVRM